MHARTTRNRIPFSSLALAFAAALGASAETLAPSNSCSLVKGLSYYSGQELLTADAYQRSQCRLDLRYPTNQTGFATLVWFHGGGLTAGKRSFPELHAPQLAVAAVGYRLSPKGKLPSFIEDAAASTAWVIAHIAEYGGDSNKVFVAGHSAGGYLTAMIGMDPKWLAARGVSNLQLAGLIPISAQVSTHFHVKKLRGDAGPQYRPLIDEYAPLYYCASNLPPICLITGGRSIEFKCRVEENDLMAASLRTLGHRHVEFHELSGFDHGTIGAGAMPLTLDFIHKISDPPVPTPLPRTLNP
jgi:acetyl esterase/lipase